MLDKFIKMMEKAKKTNMKFDNEDIKFNLDEEGFDLSIKRKNNIQNKKKSNKTTALKKIK